MYATCFYYHCIRTDFGRRNSVGPRKPLQQLLSALPLFLLRTINVAAFPGLSIREWKDILKSPRRKKGHFYCAYQTNEKAPFKQANKIDAASEMHHVIRTSIMGSMPYFHSLSNAMAQAVGFNVNDVRERESIDQQ